MLLTLKETKWVGEDLWIDFTCTFRAVTINYMNPTQLIDWTDFLLSRNVYVREDGDYRTALKKCLLRVNHISRDEGALLMAEHKEANDEVSPNQESVEPMHDSINSQDEKLKPQDADLETSESSADSSCLDNHIVEPNNSQVLFFRDSMKDYKIMTLCKENYERNICRNFGDNARSITVKLKREDLFPSSLHHYLNENSTKTANQKNIHFGSSVNDNARSITVKFKQVDLKTKWSIFNIEGSSSDVSNEQFIFCFLRIIITMANSVRKKNSHNDKYGSNEQFVYCFLRIINTVDRRNPVKVIRQILMQ